MTFGYNLGFCRHRPVAAPAASVWRLASVRAGETSFGTQGASSSAVQRNRGRQKDTLGAASYSRLRYVDVGFYVDTANVENALGNSYDTQRGLEIASQVRRVLWSGANVATIPSGSGGVASDDILPSSFSLAAFSGGTSIWHRNMSDVAVAGMQLGKPTIDVGTPAGEASYRTPNTVDDLLVTGALAVSGTTSGNVCAPQRFIGFASNHGPTVLVIGDSRFYGFGGNDGAGTATAGGPPRMALEAAGIPHEMQARSSTRLTQIVASSFANWTNRQNAVQYVSDILSNYGTNDLANGRTAIQLIADVQALVVKAKAINPLVRVWQSTVTPRTNTSNVPTAGFANGETTGRKAFNDALKANWASWGLSGYVDISAAVENPDQTDQWANVGNTTDGLHSMQVNQDLEKVPIQNWATGLAAPLS